MGQATRTTKLLLDVGKREEGGANTGKQASLEATASLLNHARAFYIDFFCNYSGLLTACGSSQELFYAVGLAACGCQAHCIKNVRAAGGGEESGT